MSKERLASQNNRNGNQAKKYKLLKLSHFRCKYCRVPLRMELGHNNSFTIDHRVPTSKGGSNTFKNMVACCLKCNVMKGSMDLKDFIELLKQLQK